MEDNVAMPDRHDYEVQCDGCGEIAIVEVAKNDYAFQQRRGMRIGQIKKGDVSAKMTIDATCMVRCNLCGTGTSWFDARQDARDQARRPN